MTRVLAAIDAFDVWLDRRRLCWKATVVAGISCIATTLLFIITALLRTGEMPARLEMWLFIATPLMIVVAFVGGLAAEWLAKRRRGAAA